MAQILINIPDFLYKQILKKHVSKATIARVFQNGVVLPKGHGLEQEPCEDAISLASVFEIMGNLMSIPYDFDRSITEKDVSESMDKIRELPRVTPQEPFKPMVKIDLYSVIKQKYIEREALDNAIKEIKNAGYNNIVPIGEQIGDHRVKLCKVIEVDEVLKILEMNTGKAQSK